ncbi:MAG: transposase [Sulfuritalea sp.]|jgi:transposase|nr:transposase [Sulfuritalea sp.]
MPNCPTRPTSGSELASPPDDGPRSGIDGPRRGIPVTQSETYVLKESFGQLWSYQREGWARRFFDNWKASLKWQRLKPYEKFAEMIERHWDGIAAYCNPENKVSLGFVEGLNNKIRVIQRRAYGLRDEQYLRLKVLTCMLPKI